MLRSNWLGQSVCVAVVCVLTVSAASADSFGTGTNQFTIDFVTISGNTNPTSGLGIVNNDYRIGVYEITNDQWEKFNASLPHPVLGDPASAYDNAPSWTGTSIPTNQVSWYEAAQFVNWLNTGTGHQAAYKFTGTEGTSGYTFATWSSAEAAGGTNLYRHKDAMYYLPSEDEWVKAAYWNGTALQTYANASPSDLLGGVPDPAKWNYSPSAGSEPWVVGAGREELNGTFDMMGNAWEWTESPWNDPGYGIASNRATRGGSYGYSSDTLTSLAVGRLFPFFEMADTGFRVASGVPEHASVALVCLGGLALLRRTRA